MLRVRVQILRRVDLGHETAQHPAGLVLHDGPVTQRPHLLPGHGVDYQFRHDTPSERHPSPRSIIHDRVYSPSNLRTAAVPSSATWVGFDCHSTGFISSSDTYPA